MTSECRSHRRLIPLAPKRPNRFYFLNAMTPRSVEKRKRCYSYFIICFKASLLLVWLIPFLYWVSSSSRSIELNINGIPTDLHLRRAAMKEYHHHIKRKANNDELPHTLVTRSGSTKGDASSQLTEADKLSAYKPERVDNEKFSLHDIINRPAIIKQESSSSSSRLSTQKPKSTTTDSSSSENGPPAVMGQLEEIDNQLKIGQDTVVLSRKDRLSSRIGCNWKRGTSALFLEDESATLSDKIFKRGAFSRGDVHPHIVLHNSLGETKAWSPKDKRT
jgi:hypothetical protein